MILFSLQYGFVGFSLNKRDPEVAVVYLNRKKSIVSQLIFILREKWAHAVDLAEVLYLFSFCIEEAKNSLAMLK